MLGSQNEGLCVPISLCVEKKKSPLGALRVCVWAELWEIAMSHLIVVESMDYLAATNKRKKQCCYALLGVY